MKPEPDIKITRIAERWHARLFVAGEVVDEMACASRLDLGWICREMLRWQDKTGNSSKYTSSARERQSSEPNGKVWWFKDLLEERT